MVSVNFLLPAHWAGFFMPVVNQLTAVEGFWPDALVKCPSSVEKSRFCSNDKTLRGKKE